LKKTQNQLMIGIIHCRTIVVFWNNAKAL
jgi:hypothetical protein